MNIEDMNTLLREMTSALLQEGYKKTSICATTLGTQSNPQFSKFVEGNDLGLKAMQRFFDGLGYDLHVVPVRKEDSKRKSDLETDSYEFAKDSHDQLSKYLKDRNVKRGPVSGSGEVNEALQSVLEQELEKIDF